MHCETSHKEVSQFYSPWASSIASQLYSAYAEWYSLREFGGEYNITEPYGFNITLLRSNKNITLAFSANL